MKWPTWIALGGGLIAVVLLIATNHAGEVVRALRFAGWGVLAVVLVHVPQTLLATLGWRTIIVDAKAPRLPRLFLLRWIKEAVNSLLPVAQIGGDFARARLLIRDGVSLRVAAASCTVDVAAGTLCLFAYMTLGLGVFLLAPHEEAVAQTTEKAIAVAGVIALLVVLAPRLGLLRLIERLIERFGEEKAWAGLGDLTGLHNAVAALYRDHRRLLVSGFYHLLAWLGGTLETYVALSVLGLHPTLREAFVIDSLGQAVRAAGFAIPGALGVQEGGYILVCSLFGVPAEQALALSMIRRIREVILGLPGLFVWGRLESAPTR